MDRLLGQPPAPPPPNIPAVEPDVRGATTIREQLAQRPHPKAGTGKFFATKTLLDWADWMFKNSGTKGKLQVLRTLNDLKGVQ